MNQPPSAALTGINATPQCADERRMCPDRREEPTGPWSALPPAGNRICNRRLSEHQRPYFVDRFSLAMGIGVLLLLTASMVDAALTIHLLRAGGVEVNPLMDHVLSYGVWPFLAVKYMLTAAGLPLLLVFKNYYLFGTRFRVAYLIPLTVALYAILISYQLLLIQQHAPL